MAKAKKIDTTPGEARDYHLQKLAEATHWLKRACNATRRQKKQLVVEMFLILGLLTNHDLQLYRETCSLDFYPKSEGERELRRYLARSKDLRDLCRRYRPATWARLAPTPEEIKRETAKWERRKGG